MDDLPTDADLSQYLPGGPVDTVFRFLRAIFEERSYSAAWQMMDENLQLCRIQAWLWNNRAYLNLTTPRVLDMAAIRMYLPGNELWPEFAEIELGQLIDSWGTLYAAGLGAGSLPRPLGPDLENIVLVPTDGEMMRIAEPTLVPNALVFAVRTLDDGRMAIAGFEGFVPEPGWPPVFGPPEG